MESRDPNKTETAIWTKYKTGFTGRTKPMVQKLILLSKIAVSAQEAARDITGKNFELINAEDQARINTIGHHANILDNQITGVLLKKYGVVFDGAELKIVASPNNVDEGDILPSFAGLGVAPFLVVAGIAGVVLLAGGFVTLRVVEVRTKNETQRLMADMRKLDAQMMKQPKEQREEWAAWRDDAAKQAEAAVKHIPGATGLLSQVLGESGTRIAVSAIAGIAALYFLIPRLRRN